MIHRNANLDLLRAIAIAMVVVYHGVQMWPVPQESLARVTALGAYGVDLFFVLSGWLVGGLYWREHEAHGRVEAGRFIGRRLLRTVPCYLVALAASWLAVRLTDPQRAAFDPAYLVFLQNYRPTMPYFLVSWSLCIEEHFYLVLPLAVLVAHKIHPRLLHWLWPLCLLPLIARAVESQHEIGVFGRPWTATHFRFEGMLAGVAAARWHWPLHARWPLLAARARVLWAPLLAAAITLYYTAFTWFYVAGLSFLALGFLCLLLALVDRPSLKVAAHPWVKAVALASYSTYLTHALMIHVSRLAIARLHLEPGLPSLLVFGLFIALGGGLFYLLIEKPCLRLRDRWLPAIRGS